MANKYKYIFIMAQIIALVIAVLSFFYGLRGCAVPKTGLTQGCTEKEVREPGCPAGTTGRYLEICKNNGWVESFKDCRAGGGDCKEAVFNRDVAPLITARCVSCHPGYDSYDTAKGKIDAFITRTNLAEDNGNHMPKNGKSLLQPEKDILAKWKADKLLLQCPDNGQTNPHITSNDLEEAALLDINSLNAGTQTETRWLYTADKSNEGAGQTVLKQFEAAVQKGINQMSFKRNVVLAVPVDKNKTLFRFNLNDIGLTAAAWNLIEANDPLNLESATNIGAVLKNLTNSKKPIMSVSAFNFSAQKAGVYYAVRKIAATESDFLKAVGVDAGSQLANFQALQVGFANSPISLNKNRLLARFDSNDGALWLTFDTVGNVTADRNLFQFPLLKSASGKADFKFDASEAIFSLPNGLHGYALFDAAGKRLDAAALNIVTHNVNPPANPEIRDAISCYRCHHGGFIEKKDEIRNSVDQNAAQFDLRDVDLVDVLYRDPARYFAEDNGQYGATLSKMGILVTDADPLNISVDSLAERNLDARAVASFLLLTEEEFKAGLGRSAQGRAQVGQLLSNGTITFEQFQKSLPVLIKDLRIGQDPLNP